ncbi:DUF1127 domain-containing protein [Rhizobium sp. S153]|uniref:DUF1127 domain-containing protein n=1 Tax=Ciceribacter sichuanensis TaxID=2949647 RepID=A0ABT0VF17_9HYPH|nr:DUF1127 domain-containing protein [Ciceribacter sp. S153]MCM2403060.1 DUF1127 domain-containing protein [Ciceribacter sp. S153]
MSTTERMIELDIASSRQTLVQRLVAVLATMRSVWRAMRNRRAANCLAELDDFQLRDIGLSRSEVNRILGMSGIADDPSQQLSRAARNHARRALQGLPVD